VVVGRWSLVETAGFIVIVRGVRLQADLH
jgi:hypothetical protein